MKKISICVPCFNEVNNVRPMAETLIRLMDALPYEYEIIFTDNCSEDGTKQILRELAAKNKQLKVLINNRNYGTDGRSARNSAKYITGDVMISIACDFQEPPELIPEFIKYWEQGYKVVCGQKIGSKEGKLKYTCRSIYYKLIGALSDTRVYSHISGIMLCDMQVFREYMKSDYDYHFRFALGEMGYEVKLIPYEQQERRSGKSSYNIWRYLSFSINSMIVTSATPLRLITIIGVMMSFVSFLIGVVYLIMKLLFWNTFQAGTAPGIPAIVFFGYYW